MNLRMIKRLVVSFIVAVALAGTSPAIAAAGQKTVHVKEYRRKDGTVVKAHDRKAPKSNGETAAPAAAPSPVSRASTAAARSDRCESCDRDEHGRIVRSGKAKKAFMTATGYPHGRPGYVIDHLKPLACGGADLPSNMQWQTKEAARAKDKVERQGC
jgi:hypothetical protein